MRRLRLANLSYAQLLEIAVEACESSPELKRKADARNVPCVGTFRALPLT